MTGVSVHLNLQRKVRQLQNRSPLQVEEEERILAEAEAITAARKRAASAARPGGAAPLLHPDAFSNDVPDAPFFDRAATAVAPPKPGVYLRRAALEDAKKAAQQHSAHGAKAAKLLETVLSDTAKVGNALPTTVTRATMGAYLALYLESCSLVELKLHAQRGAVKTNPEEGRGKRQIKSKGPRDYEDPSPAPPVKRRR